jgi:coenzyme F420-reducing hydrogenase delta subunit
MSTDFHVVVLACRQAAPEAEALAGPLQAAGLQARVAPEPCSSKVEVYHLLRILADSADLVWVVGCPADRCLMIEGSSRMGKRVAYARQYLAEIGVEPERLGMSRLAAGDAQGLSALVQEIQSRAQGLRPSPARRGRPAGTESL